MLSGEEDPPLPSSYEGNTSTRPLGNASARRLPTTLLSWGKVLHDKKNIWYCYFDLYQIWTSVSLRRGIIWSISLHNICEGEVLFFSSVYN